MMQKHNKNNDKAVADPVFPIGGANLRPGHFSAKMCVKTKQLDPRGGRGLGFAPPAPPGSTTAKYM